MGRIVASTANITNIEHHYNARLSIGKLQLDLLTKEHCNLGYTNVYNTENTAFILAHTAIVGAITPLLLSADGPDTHDQTHPSARR
jgi:hypothetical protein